MSPSVVVMGESHFIPPPYSIIHREDLYFRVPDSSAPKMAYNISETRLLI